MWGWDIMFSMEGMQLREGSGWRWLRLRKEMRGLVGRGCWGKAIFLRKEWKLMVRMCWLDLIEGSVILREDLRMGLRRWRWGADRGIFKISFLDIVGVFKKTVRFLTQQQLKLYFINISIFQGQKGRWQQECIILIIVQMIKVIYKDEKLWNWKHVIWSTVLFLMYSATLYYFIIKVCFQSLIGRPPIPVSVIFLLLMLADRLYLPVMSRNFFSISFGIDMLVWFMIFFAVFLPSPMQNKVSWLGLASIVYLFDVRYLKQVLFDLTRRNYWIYKFYILVKITYWIIMYAHFIGCIFYGIDEYLISTEHFGPFAQNNDVYYQGTLLAYTPIYMFDGFNRYVYAMYYSFALISTIAFGDIIGKNYIEDAYVMILIVLSTIVISLVIEQMYIIFRRRKTRFLQLINKARFLSERLQGYSQIPWNFRQEIINYLIDSNWVKMNQYPPELDTNQQFKAKIISQSVIANPQLPVFYAKNLLHHLEFKRLPKGILVAANVPHRQDLKSYMVTGGKLWIGHMMLNGKMVGGSVAEREGMNFGIEQTLAGTNNVYPMLAVRTLESTTVLTISQKEIRAVLKKLEQSVFPGQSPIEQYQIAKDKAIFSRNKYPCHICAKQFPERVPEHTLIDCPQCHLVIEQFQKLSLIQKTNERMFRVRSLRRHQKIKDANISIFSEGEKSWKLIQLERLGKMIRNMREDETMRDQPLEEWHKWEVYGKELGFNLQFQAKPRIINNYASLQYESAMNSPSLRQKISDKPSVLMNSRIKNSAL